MTPGGYVSSSEETGDFNGETGRFPHQPGRNSSEGSRHRRWRA
ncbi:hypothetical protein [Pseudofrankia asymbiotica]|nr:hypothetical protein [Pseudofrankia asymbiotica]